MIEAAKALPNDDFGFSDLRSAIPAAYDALQPLLFEILEAQPGLIEQVYDAEARSIRFRRSP